jgi:hypothetical protein
MIDLRKLSDTELLDLLDQVSDEVKRRNTLVSPSDGVCDEESLGRAADLFAEIMREATSKHR